jgi:hypothetical protein
LKAFRKVVIQDWRTAVCRNINEKNVSVKIRGGKEPRECREEVQQSKLDQKMDSLQTKSYGLIEQQKMRKLEKLVMNARGHADMQRRT